MNFAATICRIFLSLKGVEPYRPHQHDTIILKVERYHIETSWTTYSKRRWFTRWKYKGIPTIKAKFTTPKKSLELQFILRSEQDVEAYLHKYFLAIANASQDCPNMLGGQLTTKETDFMVQIRSVLSNDPHSMRRRLTQLRDGEIIV
jgi:hypothetical protein